jgi:hypothetical protein
MYYDHQTKKNCERNLAFKGRVWKTEIKMPPLQLACSGLYLDIREELFSISHTSFRMNSNNFIQLGPIAQ